MSEVDPTRLAAAIEAYLERDETNTLANLAFEARANYDTVRRIRSGKLDRVTIDYADRLCMALQIDLDTVVDQEQLVAVEDLEAWCRGCREVVGVSRDARCPWCDRIVPLGAKRGKPFDRHLRHVSPELLRSAYQLYARGASLRQVARVLHPRTTYSSPASCAQSLHDAWTARGWRLRDRKAAITAFNQRNGKRPPKGTPEYAAHRAAQRRARGEVRGVPCAATTKRGTPCANAALAGGEFCTTHEPARQEAMLAKLADARARSRRS